MSMKACLQTAGRAVQHRRQSSSGNVLTQHRREGMLRGGKAVLWRGARAFSSHPDATKANDRSSFQEYWRSDHSEPSLEKMMLDSDASTMDRLERPEILSALPSLHGKRILELGAGIGRFSGLLAQKADQVVAVDFVESSCVENRRANAACANLSVVHADVTMFEQEPGSYDLVFSNWLLMYLTDEEVRQFADNALKWLRPGGQLFFRESCFHASGNATRRFNPTKYRTPDMYSQMFSEATEADGSRFQLQATNCLESYALMKGNMHQMWFRWSKVTPKASERAMRLLNHGLYSPANCLRYEKIYGRGYIYTGGEEISQRLLEYCSDWLKKGARCLDVGAALGGTPFHFVEKRPDIFVHGVIHSGELYSLVAGRRVSWPKHIRDRVTISLAPEHGVPEHELDYAPNSFDVLLVRECLMFSPSHDKGVLMQKFFRLLRPGGRLLVVDYGAGKPQHELSPRFLEYIQKCQYFLDEPQVQKEQLSRYFDVEYKDATAEFVDFMDDGLAKINEHFGPSAPERLAAEKNAAEPLDVLAEPLTAKVRSLFPELPSDLVHEIAHESLSKLDLFRAEQRAEADICEKNYNWGNAIWQLEKDAALNGDLRWSFFICTKRS